MTPDIQFRRTRENGAEPAFMVGETGVLAVQRAVGDDDDCSDL